MKTKQNNNENGESTKYLRIRIEDELMNNSEEGCNCQFNYINKLFCETYKV